MELSKLAIDYKKIVDTSGFKHNFLESGKFSSSTRKRENGEEYDVIEQFTGISMVFNSTTIDLSIIATANMIFNMFDLILEEGGKISGDSFRQRCLSMNVTDKSKDLDIIREFIYRILKLIRNAVTHEISSISETDDRILIEYYRTYYKKTEHFKLHISEKNLMYIM